MKITYYTIFDGQIFIQANSNSEIRNPLESEIEIEYSHISNFKIGC